ncbi:hypothetical protein RN001_008658 [Aquatica leii]|uniref:C2H2-type domain-containing protein n=1 Tax=Aquatica leii TaxID=1421715 RepID=A0AAN7P9W9_9COLE|nr:hypothetical protein RN001_008658 [Aquatica leii]
MPINIMAKNYSHCPLKKRPVHLVEDISDQPENLSTKPEDLSISRHTSVSPPVTPLISPSVSPPSSPATSPPISPPMSPPSPTQHLYQPIKTENCVPYRPPISPEYAPQTWHRSVTPLYPPAYHPFMPYHYNHEYMGIMSPSSPYSDSSCSPPHPHTHNQPLAPLALRPTMYSSIDQSSLSPNSSTTSPPPPTTNAEDLSEKRRQGIRHQCPDCGKSYSTFSGLSKHRQFHCAAGDGPRKSFSCKYCEKVYVSLGALKMHIRTHTLPYVVEESGNVFLSERDIPSLNISDVTNYDISTNDIDVDAILNAPILFQDKLAPITIRGNVSPKRKNGTNNMININDLRDVNETILGDDLVFITTNEDISERPTSHEIKCTNDNKNKLMIESVPTTTKDLNNSGVVNVLGDEKLNTEERSVPITSNELFDRSPLKDLNSNHENLSIPTPFKRAFFWTLSQDKKKT